MKLPKVVSRQEWLAARKRLLAREKEETRAHDALSEERRALPMVKLDKDYVLHGPANTPRVSDRPVHLHELFDGRRQLIVLHVMFHEDKGQACTGCSYSVDNLPHLSHLHARETTLVLVSRAALPSLAGFAARMGWTAPWYSSLDSDFNYDFHATTDETVAPVEYNYRDKATLERLGLSYHVKGEQPAVSVFLRDGEDVYHTYSTYGRGLEMFLGTYRYLDITPLGRGEGWGGMPDLHGLGQHWLRHHDRYEK